MVSKVLIISWNIVPVTDKSIPVSATGMRSYKLALGLLDNGCKTTDIAIKNYDEPMGKCVDKRINIYKWETDEQVAALASKYDAVIINANLEDKTPRILKAIDKRVVKVVDAFIPLYLEEALTQDRSKEKRDFHVRKLAFLHESLALADYILVANQQQKMMYIGAMGAVNLFNADNFSTYEDNFIINYPGIIEEKIPTQNPYEEYKETIKGRKIVVWFGSIYQWYDISLLMKAYETNKDLAKETILFVIGAKNPKFESDDPSHTSSNNESIIFVPWVDYEKRLGWLANADVGVSINRLTFENTFSFRNRLLDYMEAGLPLVTNGQDPLGEEIIAQGGGLIADENDMGRILLASLGGSKNRDLREGVVRLKKYFSNQTVGAALVAAIQHKRRPILNKDFLRYPHSDIKQLEKLLLKLRWYYDYGSPGVEYLRTGLPEAQSIDDVLRFVSTKDITNTAMRRLQKAAKTKVKRPFKKKG